jgi:protein-S-isoprenylcysteine O-methyltransferase Ste14
MEAGQINRMAVKRFSGAVLVLGAIFFLPAGTLRYWQAWVYMAVLFFPMILVLRYLARHDPELLERRLAMREERKKQTAIQLLASVTWLAAFLIPGLDQRFGWSAVPWQLVVVSDVMVLGGYLLFFFVMKENSYAARVIQVQEGQSVITTGPYALVRHPMYLAVLTMFLFSPLALGSYWAIIPVLLMPLFLVLRIQDEEEMLVQELPTYREYTQQTRFRLIPGVW